MAQNSQNTALLVMDMQAAIVAGLPGASEAVDNVAKAIAFARSINIPVIYVTVGFRAGFPEISPNNKSFTAFKDTLSGTKPEEFTAIEASLAPQPGEVIITKRRISAFTGSDLEVILRAQGIQHIVLSGIATSGVVLSTLREAADKDYRITVLADCCADRDEEVHRVLVTKIFPRQASVLTAAEWTNSAN
jgi:nicotinamidase-related amidase